MLEGLVASLLNRFLGLYITNFDPKQLNVGIWSGDVKLRDLELRREALDQLKLPINVTKGHLGQLTLRIPWSNLRGQPVQVYIEDVYVLASPKEDAKWDEDEEKRRRHVLKMEKLNNAEILKERAQEGLSQEEQQKNQSFTESLVTKIVDNLQISIKNIHIRYEDSLSSPDHPFALGITLQEFSAISTDKNWKSTFVQNSLCSTHKLAKLGALAIYWNTDTRLLGSGREAEISDSEMTLHDEVLKNFKSMIIEGQSLDMINHKFMLKPVNGIAKIEIDKSGKIDKPQISSQLVFDEIGMVLDEDQYRDALMLVDLFHYFVRHQEYMRLKPKNVRPKQDPRAWLMFACNAILSKIHDRNRRWTWEYFRERRDDRIRYIELYKKKKQQDIPLTDSETTELTDLEWKREFDDLRFWRSLAMNQLKKENAVVNKTNSTKKNQTWAAWVWGSKLDEEEQTPETIITEEQKKEFYDAIDWDEKSALAEIVDLPKESVKLQIGASLNTGSFTLKRSLQKSEVELVGLFFDGFRASFLQRPESYLAKISLEGLRVNDGTVQDSLFKQIVKVKDAPNIPTKKILLDRDTQPEESSDPFFQFIFENNPIDGVGDLSLSGRMKPLEIIWNPKFLVEITNFFQPPERYKESVGALMETAGATVESLRQQTRAGLVFALEEHKTLNAMLDLQAPLIVIPQSITEEKSVCLILDAGHISVNSQIVDKETLNQIQKKQEQSHTNEDYQCLESLMYDKFLVKLSSTQLLIGPSIQEAKAQIDKRDDSKLMHIVEKINIDFMVETSIIPKAPDIAKVRVSGRLPLLHVSVSDEKYKSFMRIIEVALPRFQETEGPTPSYITTDFVAKTQSQSNASKAKNSKEILGHRISDTAQQLLIDPDKADESSGVDRSKILKSNESILLKQNNFELKFEVDRLKGSLFRSDIEGRNSDKLLVELVADNFMLNVAVRKFDLTIDTSLHSLMIDDYVERTSKEFQSIISSGDTTSGDPQNLITVNIVLVNKDSPEFISRWKSVDVNIKVAISTINLIVTRKTLLTLLDFILVTFATSDTSSLTYNRQIKGAEDKNVNQYGRPRLEAESSTVWIKVDVKCIRMILNNDGTRLATLSLNNTDIGIFVTSKKLCIEAKVANLVLLDDMVGNKSRDSSFRELITIQGEDLADFRYETFDLESDLTYPGYESSIYLRAGSIKLNFLEEPFRNIIGFLVKFGKMQAIFNAARQAAANQASQIQQNASCTKIDINIKSPIVVFPRAYATQHFRRDMITAHLGEIYAQNNFTCVDDTKNSPIVMNLSTGIRNIRLTSTFYFPRDRYEELELIDRLDLIFIVEYIQHWEGSKRPELQIESKMTDVTLRISQTQVSFLLEIAKSLPSVLFENEVLENNIQGETPESAMKPIRNPESSSDDNIMLVDLGPELKCNSKNWTKLNLSFHVETISLELILANENEPIDNLEQASLSRFSLDATKLRLRVLADDSLESELLVHSLRIWDSRAQTKNKFRKIMAPLNTDAQQFMARVTLSGQKERNVIIIVAIDSPRVIFALDYLFAIQEFLDQGLSSKNLNCPKQSNITVDPAVIHEDRPQKIVQSNRERSRSSEFLTGHNSLNEQSFENEQATSIAYRVNVIDAQIILIADPFDASSDAIVLGTKQILVAQQNVTTLQISEMGIFLCRMNRFKDFKLRILDNFSAQMSLERPDTNSINIQIDIEPLVLRLSLRDILLALEIVSKASELSGTEDKNNLDSKLDTEAGPSMGHVGRLKNQSSAGMIEACPKKKVPAEKSSVSPMHVNKTDYTINNSSKKEKLVANFQGLRLILIGDLHELPILDFSVRSFSLILSDWTSNVLAGTTIDLFINIYNFKKITWEPLIEPWQLNFQILNQKTPDLMTVNLESSKTLELTINSAAISLASKSAQLLSQKYDLLSKPRGVDAPYRIRNQTGFELTIWADESESSNKDQIVLKLKDCEEAPWQFEKWEKMRENLSPDANNRLLGIRLEGSEFKEVNKIPVHREGSYLFVLKPRLNDILHRILVDVAVGNDSVKRITFRSPLLVKNDTLIPVEIGIYDAEKCDFLRIDKIPPGESHPAPVGAAFTKTILVRPDEGFGYTWSNKSLWWRDLLKKPTETITCTGDKDNIPTFYFQMHANFKRNNPLSRIYPYMEIRLFPPIEVENLLPYDFRYNIYDKNTQSDWSNFLRKGGVSSVHVVNLSHLLLLSIDICDTPFRESIFSIINDSHKDYPEISSKLVCNDDAGLSLNLCLHYFKIPGSDGAFRVSIYSPYVILNKIGLSIQIKAKLFLSTAKRAAGQEFQTNPADSERCKALPYMFAYERDDQRNRAILKVGESNWSKPQSFDAIGSASEVILSSSTDNTEIHVGISVAAGEGKYKMTKIVTLAPRFILKNQMGGEINIREPGSSKLMTLKPYALEPLHFLQKSSMKQLSLCYPDLNSDWSSPFNISDLGTTYVKIAKASERQNLVRVEILMENATIFLHLSMEKNHWPFSMRNESETEFKFYQENSDSNDEYSGNLSKFRRIYYRLPPRSIMPYAWDYPAIKNKELVIKAGDYERCIRLTDIGSLDPMKIPSDREAAGNRKYTTIYLNVKADGPTQTLILSNHVASKSLIKQKSRYEFKSSKAVSFVAKPPETSINFRAELCLAGVGISVINSHPIELSYITLRGIKLKYSESLLYQTIVGSINWIQVDNQLYGGIFPIILYPSVVPKITRETESHPSVHVMVTRVKDDSYGVLYIKYATILLQQMTLEIDEDFVFSLLEFAKSLDSGSYETSEGALCDERLDIPEPKHDQSPQDIYFELLNIQPMQLDLSFVRTDRVNVEDKIPSRNPLMFFLNVLTMTIGNINDAPVRLNALLIENARVSKGVLMQNMSSHYSQQALSQVHKIIGSADVLGNPVGLFNNLSSGVADFFFEPYQGLIMSEQSEDIGLSIAKGAASLMKKSVFGFSDSVSKFTGSIAKGLAEASMDKQFQDHRRMVRSRNRPKHALFGVTAGANSFVSSFASGVGGVAQKPFEGAEQEGLTGFLKGIGKGAIGLVTKPATGLFDLASNVSEGIRNTTTVFDADELDRVRLTRYIGADDVIRPYSQREALGQYWLKQLDNGKYFKDLYLAHLELPRQNVVLMATYNRILLFKSRKLITEWNISFEEIAKLIKERNGLQINLRGGKEGIFVSIEEKSSLDFMYEKIVIAVHEYNLRYNATSSRS